MGNLFKLSCGGFNMSRRQKWVWMMSLLVVIHSITNAAYFTVSPWFDDATTGIDSSYTYTHAVNVGTTGIDPNAIAGLAFTTGLNSGTNWSYTDTNGEGPYSTQDSDNNITGESAALASEFHFYGELLTLTGLTPDSLYEITLLSCEWDSPSERLVTITHGNRSHEYNQNMYGVGNGVKFVGIYRADENGELNLGLSGLHLYAFANRENTDEVPIVIFPVKPVDYDGVTQINPDTVELIWDEVVAGSLTNPLFDVYMDPNETNVETLDPVALVSSQQSDFSFVPDIDPNQLYYWSVVTYLDGEPNQVTDVRSFHTGLEGQVWTEDVWTGDWDVDVSAGKIYTHKVNFNSSESVSTPINGVAFENDIDWQGADWSLSGATNAYGGATGENIYGDGATLVKSFYWGDPATLTLIGLTPDENYVLTKYVRGWGSVGTRVVNVTTSAEGRTTALDQNIYDNATGVLYKYFYTAPASGTVTLTFNAINSGNSWHHYGFSNEVATDIYLDPTPLPGSALDADGGVELSWILNGDISNPSYNIKVATDPNLINLVDDQSGLAVATYNPTVLVDEEYYWQVEVVEEGGLVVHTSPIWDFSTVPLPDAIKILEWKLDEEANYIAEENFLGEDGTLIGIDDPNTFGVSRVYGLVNNGLYFNGSGQYVDVSDAIGSIPVNDGDFSIAGYFRTVADYGPLFSMRSNTSDQPILTIAIGHDGAQTVPGAICVLVRDDAGVLSGMNSGITTVNDGQWHYYAVTRLGSIWTLYIDGVSVDDMTGSTSGFAFNLLGFGTDIYWTTTYGWTDAIYYKGILDEVTIWENALKADQLASLAAILPPQGDIDYDLVTDLNDLIELANAWLTIETECSLQPTDLNGDCAVDMLDFSEVAEGWLNGL